MPWKETSPVVERLKFVEEYGRQWELLEGHVNVAALCRDFGVSRKTGYKWLDRYVPGDLSSLEDRSRRPHHHPQQLPEAVVEAVLTLRRSQPLWGPKKLGWAFDKQYPHLRPPSLSAMAAILKRHGMITPKKRRRAKVPPFTAPFAGCEAPNETWCADYKGWFYVGRTKCHPLTLSDGYCRQLLRCTALRRPRFPETRRVFESAFREFGLPSAIRTDNGPPFSSPAVGGLSKLSVWWMRLGIVPERIDPAHPEQNGRHERMHRTLKAHTANPPSGNMRAQQRAFDEFRRFFNEERPHEALGQTTPASWYEPSPRPWPNPVPHPEYPLALYTFRMPDNGVLPWRGRNIYISDCLAGQYVALEPIAEQTWNVYFCNMRLGNITPVVRQRKTQLAFVRAPTVERVSWEQET